MKQFYLLLIVGLVISGLVFIFPKLKGSESIRIAFLEHYNCDIWKFFVGLSFFDLSVGLANLVWVGKNKIVVIEHFIPSGVILVSSGVFFYLFLRYRYPEYEPKKFLKLFNFLDFCSKRSFYFGIFCVLIAFLHFFSESLVFF